MKRLSQALALIEFFFVVLLARILGISLVVRYLRNPNPIIASRLLRTFGAKIGQKTRVKRSLWIDNSYEDHDSRGDFSRLNIGDNCYIGDDVYFDLANDVTIEDNVVVSGRASFITHADCSRSPLLSTAFPRKSGKVTVGSGAWICFGATILPGTIVGQNCVVAAGSVVRENTEPRSLYVGLPARKLRSLS